MNEIGAVIVLFLCVVIAACEELYRRRKLERAYLAALKKGLPPYVIPDYRENPHEK